MATSASRIRIGVIYGGRSSEHEISCSTASSLLAALDPARYDIVPIGIARNGRWVLGDGDPAKLALTPEQRPEVDPDGVEVLLSTGVDDRHLILRAPDGSVTTAPPLDVAFPVLHGPFGEDGTIQGLFELSDTRYVGSGVAASAVMMDKHLMKVALKFAGLPVGPYVVVTDRAWRSDKASALDAAYALAYPVFVKPARAGSSVGISKVDSPSGLEDAIEVARRHDLKVLIEAGIEGREVECGVLQGRGTAPPRTSPLGECVVVRDHPFYDYDAKYLDPDSIELKAPTSLAPDIASQVQAMAAAAFESVGCEGLARVDFFVGRTGNIVINEVNTMPGFTPHSMYPRVWEAAGMSYPKLVDELVALAMERPLGLR